MLTGRYFEAPMVSATVDNISIEIAVLTERYSSVRDIDRGVRVALHLLEEVVQGEEEDRLLGEPHKGIGHR